MTISLQLPERHADAIPVFNALAAMQDLLAGPAAAPGVTIAQLYRLATDPQVEDVVLETRLGADPALRASFELVLQRTAAYALPKLAAASTGEVTTREGPGYRIRLQPSQAEPLQTYVIFEIDDAARTAPRTVFVCRADRAPLRHRLPDAIGGVVQVLVDADSDLLRGLRDLDAEVFLR
ncbi:MAG: hypothetical protein HQ495_00180 [Alphaproteobacteria bacterium]|nr:hypothetical protein [Alphaproteobacteria bacterium]